jgi:hypothetical protein
LRNEELHYLYFSPHNIRMIESSMMWWTGHIARMGEESSACRFSVVKVKGKRLIRRLRCRRK